MDLEIKVFTLNCWGLVMVSKHRKQRIQAIAEVLATSNYDVVCLQEVWTNADYYLIRDKTAGSLPYSHYFYSGVTGSGVCILSKHPIHEVFFHQWPVNGYIHKLHHGDWFGGKGVGLCRLKIQDFKINIYSAHLHAEYNRDCDEYQAHRVLQAFDTAQFIQFTSGDADLAILAGDLNTEPGDLAYRVLLAVPGLKDAFTEAGDTVQAIASTNESLTNSYTPPALLKGNNAPGKRIDYIMYHSGSPDIQIDLKTYQLPLPNKVPHCDFSYSDHEAISATLAISRTKFERSAFDSQAKELVLEECIQICSEALGNLANEKITYWLFTLILFVLLIAALVTKPPGGYTILYTILKVVIALFMVFMLLMATIWNKIERHAVLAGKLAMELELVIALFMVFMLLMATIWNKIERHAVLAGKLAMEVSLKRFRAK